MSYPKRPIEYSWHLHTNSIGIPPYNTVDTNKGEVTPTSFIPKKYTASPSLTPSNLTTPTKADIDNEVHASDNCVRSRKVPPSLLQAPVGIPAMPLYGYDNCEDSEKDCDYMKQMYPITAKKIMREVIEECDKLEYDGSCMFDEYPDRIYLERIVDRIYERCRYLGETPVEVPESIMPEGYMEQEDMDIIPYEYVSYRSPIHKPLHSLQYNPYSRPNRPPGHNGSNHRPRPNRPPQPPRQQNNWLRDLIEIMLFNEMLNRRRRYRGRKSWY